MTASEGKSTTIAQWHETTLVDRGSALAATLLGLPTHALRADERTLPASTVAARLELVDMQKVPSVTLPMVLAAVLLPVERESFLDLLQQRRTEEGWTIPHDLLTTREFHFAERLAFLPVVPLARPSLRLESLAGLASTATGDESGVYVAFIGADSTPLVLVSVPAGIVICGAADGMARVKEEGLRTRILRLVRGGEPPGRSPVPAASTDAEPEPPEPEPQATAEGTPKAVLQRDELKDGTLGPEMVVIPAGSFVMGSSEQEDEGPPHRVTLSRSFAMGKCPVTFQEYDHFAEATGRTLPADNGWGRDRQPVINISWADAVAYAEWLSEQAGKRYRLPTEAEWEYAARAGTESAYWWGDEIGQNRANCDGCGSPWDDLQPAPVSSFPPNAFGLHEMLGNVWEWIEDCWHDDYNDAPTDGSAWLGDESGPRMVRGGSWAVGPEHLRSALRYGASPDELLDSLGFRLVREL